MMIYQYNTEKEQCGLDMIQSCLLSVPAVNIVGAIGGGIGNLYGWEQLYNDLKNLKDK